MPSLHPQTFALFPGQCLLCHSRTGIRLDLCHCCIADLPWLTLSCHYCALPLPQQHQGTGICAECRIGPPPFSAVLAGFEYRFPINRLIHRFKDQHNRAAGLALARLTLLRVLSKLPPIEGTETIVAVPTHGNSHRRRGFNPALDIARLIARTLGLPIRAPLIRVMQAPAQKALSRTARQSNLKGVFQAKEQISGRILLIDDVVTTGATAVTITNVLHKAGAEDVIVIALARTPAVHPSAAQGTVW